MRIIIDMQGAQSAGSRNRGIGRYTRAIAKALLRNRGMHQIMLALNGNFADTIIPIRKEFESLLSANDIHVWQSPRPASFLDPAHQVRRNMAELTYESFLASLKPDFVYVTSLFEGLIDDTITSIHRLSSSAPVAVTLYDLIPYLYPDPYLENPAVKAWYLEKLEHLRKADLWLAISESSRQDAIAQLGLSEEWTVNIATDADAAFHPLSMPSEREISLRTQYGLSKAFVLYTGGIDYRKNIEALIRAFASLPQPVQDAHQLAIVCSVQPASREQLLQLARQQGLHEQDVVLTGFVPDADLLAFYNLCKLFIFPSWYEGFGLPALEAMRCGAPVIAANASSLPEIIAWDEALFDPHSDESMARMIERGLTDEPFRQALVENGKRQACRFSWNDSAKHAIAAMERKREQWNSTVLAQAKKRPKLAYVSPLPPLPSGISDYSAELLPELGQFYDIDVIVEQNSVADRWVMENCPVRTTQWLRQNAGQYDRVLYHFGNSEFHQHMFQLLEDVPGVVVLHDFFLSGILAHMEIHAMETNIWRKSLYDSHGHIALREYQRTADISEIIWKYPCSLGVIQSALGMIVHSPYSLRLASLWYAVDDNEWAVIPHLRDSHQSCTRNEARHALGLGKSEFLVCSFGMIGPTKSNHRLLKAWQQSSLSNNPSCRLVFVGENHPGDYGQSLLQSIKAHQDGNRIHITGRVDMETFRLYLAAADLCMQLRTLSRGETSGTVVDCMNYGNPTIVNANGSLADLAPDTVWMMRDEFTDQELVQALEKLYADAPLRQRLGAAARNTIVTQRNPAICAGQYRDAIERYYQHNEGHLSVLAKAIVTQLEPTDEAEMMALATTLASNSPPSCRLWQLLVDVTMPMAPDEEYALMPQLKAWLESPPHGCRVEPVYLAEDGRYRYARSFTACLLGYDPVFSDDLIDYFAGDVFMGRASISASNMTNKEIYGDMYTHGVALRLLPRKDAILRHEFRIQPDLSEVLAILNQKNQEKNSDKKLFIDVSGVIKCDIRSGVQRVVRSVLKQLAHMDVPQFCIEPVYSVPGHQGYFYARHLSANNQGRVPLLWDDGEIAYQSGDMFFGLDLSQEIVLSNFEFYQNLQRSGVCVKFMVYDILPVIYPEFFVNNLNVTHKKWLSIIAQSSGAICISKSVADELGQWLSGQSLMQAGFSVDWFHLGADTGASLPSMGKPDNAESILEKLSGCPAFLMVGTLEPRKGHAQVLAAFEILWGAGIQVNLIMVGKQGWAVEELVEKIRGHAELERHLFWVGGVADDYLEEIYATSSCLIAASHGEGFGLPLIEAAQHKLPIIARDIPVFREVAGDGVFYFSGKDAQSLAEAIRNWLNLYENNEVPDSANIPWQTWRQSTDSLMQKLLAE